MSFASQCPDCDGEYFCEWGKQANGHSGYVLVKRDDCHPECDMSDDDLVTAFDNEMESRWERQQNDFYGGNSPQTLNEIIEVGRRDNWGTK